MGVIFRECSLYDPKLADGICAPLSADLSHDLDLT